jgi:hypothetical protein
MHDGLLVNVLYGCLEAEVATVEAVANHSVHDVDKA